MAEVKKSKKVTRIIGRVFTVFISTIVMIFAALYSAMWVFCHGPSTAARDLFVGTVLETGAMKFLAGWYFSKDEILAADDLIAVNALCEEHLVASVQRFKAIGLQACLDLRHAAIHRFKSCHELFLLSYSSRGSMYLTAP